jgi:hypothetical protein
LKRKGFWTGFPAYSRGMLYFVSRVRTQDPKKGDFWKKVSRLWTHFTTNKRGYWKMRSEKKG